MIGKLNQKPQVPEPVDIVDWRLDPEYPVFPEGSRDKTRLICPDPSPHPELIPNHPYLYKLSVRRHPIQFWSEIVASRLGNLIRIPVPQTFAAIDSSKGNCGALIEWFYGIPGNPRQKMMDGGHYLRDVIPDYDLEKGEQHNFKTVQQIFDALVIVRVMPPDWFLRWGDVFLFDALIGNTDRHQNNWGIVWTDLTYQQSGVAPTGSRTTMAQPISGELTPAFDNGTSLGYEILDEQLPRFIRDPRRIGAYVDRGTHHMKWDLSENKKVNHAEFIGRFVREYPAAAPQLRGKLSFSEDDLMRNLSGLTELDVTCPLSQNRLEFMIRLIETRKARLTEILKVGS